MVEIETRCRIPIGLWQMFGRLQWHVIPEPPAKLQGAATWWIHCHDPRASCHTAGCSHLAKSMSWSCHLAGCNNSIRYIENRFSPYFISVFSFKCSLGFDEWPLSYRLRYTCLVRILATDRQTNKRMNKWTEPLRKGALSVTTGASITVAIVFAVFFSQENLVHGLPGGTDYWKKIAVCVWLRRVTEKHMDLPSH